MQTVTEEADIIERISKTSDLIEQLTLYKNKNDELKRTILLLKKKYIAEKSSTCAIQKKEANKLKQIEDECERLKKETAILTKKHQEKLQTCQKLNYQNNQLQLEVQTLESKLNNENADIENDLRNKTAEIAELKEKVRDLQNIDVEYKKLQGQIEQSEEIIRTERMKSFEVMKELDDKSMELDMLQKKNKTLEYENSKLNWTCDQMEIEVKEIYDKCLREADMNPKILPLPSFDKLILEMSDEDEPTESRPCNTSTAEKQVSGLLPPITQPLVHESFDESIRIHIENCMPELVPKTPQIENVVHKSLCTSQLCDAILSTETTTMTIPTAKVTKTIAAKIATVFSRRQQLAKKRLRAKNAAFRRNGVRTEMKALKQRHLQSIKNRTRVVFQKRKMIEIDRTSSNQTKIFLQPGDKDIIFVDCDRKRQSFYEFRDVTDQCRFIAELQSKTPPTSTVELVQEVTSTTPGSKSTRRRIVAEENSQKRTKFRDNNCVSDISSPTRKNSLSFCETDSSVLDVVINQSSEEDIGRQIICDKEACPANDEPTMRVEDVIKHADKSSIDDNDNSDDKIPKAKDGKSSKNKAPLSKIKKLRKKMNLRNMNRKIETEDVPSKATKKNDATAAKRPSAVLPIQQKIPNLEAIKKTLEKEKKKQVRTSGFKRSTAKRSRTKTGDDTQLSSTTMTDFTLDSGNKTMSCDGEIDFISDNSAAVRCDSLKSSNLNNLLNLFFNTIDQPNCTEKTRQALQKLSISRPTDLISALIKHLEQSKDHELNKTYTPPAPMLTITEQKMILLVQKLEADNCIGLFDSLLNSIDKRILCKIQMSSLLNLSRFYMGVCKLKKNVIRLRLYLLKVTYYLKNQAIPVWFVVMAQFAEVLPKSEEAAECPIVSVIVHFIKTRNMKSEVYKTQPLQRLLSNYYQYNDERYNAEELLDRLLTLYRDDDCAINEFSIALLCKLESLVWLKTQIKKRLVPLSKSYDRFKSLIKRLLLQAGVKDFNFLVQSAPS